MKLKGSTEQPLLNRKLLFFYLLSHCLIDVVMMWHTTHTQCWPVVSLNVKERALWHFLDKLNSNLFFLFLIAVVIFSCLRDCMKIMSEGVGVKKRIERLCIFFLFKEGRVLIFFISVFPFKLICWTRQQNLLFYTTSSYKATLSVIWSRECQSTFILFYLRFFSTNCWALFSC